MGMHFISLRKTQAEAIAWFLTERAGSGDENFSLKILIDDDSITVAIDGSDLQEIEDAYVWQHPEKFGHAGIGDGEGVDSFVKNEDGSVTLVSHKTGQGHTYDPDDLNDQQTSELNEKFSSSLHMQIVEDTCETHKRFCCPECFDMTTE